MACGLRRILVLRLSEKVHWILIYYGSVTYLPYSGGTFPLDLAACLARLSSEKNSYQSVRLPDYSPATAMLP